MIELTDSELDDLIMIVCDQIQTWRQIGWDGSAEEGQAILNKLVIEQGDRFNNRTAEKILQDWVRNLTRQQIIGMGDHIESEGMGYKKNLY